MDTTLWIPNDVIFSTVRDGGTIYAVDVERASHVAGPWLSIAPERRDQSGVTVALDRTADGGMDHLYRLVAMLTDGAQVLFGPVLASRLDPISTSELTLVSPNPTPRRSRAVRGARAGRVRLELMDVSGRVEATLADRIHERGRYAASWDGADRHGRISPGLHFVRLVAPTG